MNRIKEVLEEKGIKQTRLEALIEIANLLDVDVKELIVSTNQREQENMSMEKLDLQSPYLVNANLERPAMTLNQGLDT